MVQAVSLVRPGRKPTRRSLTGMKLTVNGRDHVHSGAGTIFELLGEFRRDPRRTALMVNGEVVLRAEWDRTRLSEGDHVELLVFAGGG
jgi:thiamine biosynthesis protein ThiS